MNYVEQVRELNKSIRVVKATPSQQEKVKRVMHEFKQGKLKTPAGKTVTDRDQAIAIAMHESGQAKKSMEDELKEGIKVEMEHTDDPKIAERIAIDHLKEDAKYYTKLRSLGL